MALTPTGRVIPDAPPGSWHVDSQQETIEADATGRAVRGVRVFFTSGQGHQGSVFLPASIYTPPNVQAAVAAQAHVMDQVGSLRG